MGLEELRAMLDAINAESDTLKKDFIERKARGGYDRDQMWWLAGRISGLQRAHEILASLIINGPAPVGDPAIEKSHREFTTLGGRTFKMWTGSPDQVAQIAKAVL